MERRFIKILALVIGTVLGIVVLVLVFLLKKWKENRLVEKELSGKIQCIYIKKSNSETVLDDNEFVFDVVGEENDMFKPLSPSDAV